MGASILWYVENVVNNKCINSLAFSSRVFFFLFCSGHKQKKIKIKIKIENKKKKFLLGNSQCVLDLLLMMMIDWLIDWLANGERRRQLVHNMEREIGTDRYALIYFFIIPRLPLSSLLFSSLLIERLDHNLTFPSTRHIGVVDDDFECGDERRGLPWY